MMMQQTPSVFRLPEFWRGAARTRNELLSRHDPRYNGADAISLRYHSAIGVHEAIARALESGTPLESIPEFRAWIGRDAAPVVGPTPRLITSAGVGVDCLDIR